jgi:hypothetical protein
MPGLFSYGGRTQVDGCSSQMEMLLTLLSSYLVCWFAHVGTSFISFRVKLPESFFALSNVITLSLWTLFGEHPYSEVGNASGLRSIPLRVLK